MGVFSYQTCDTKETVRIGDYVFLILPNKKIGGRYDGYGHISGVDIYEQIAISEGSKLIGDELRQHGLSLHFREKNPIPIKFSFYELCQYEDHPASEYDPTQAGHFGEAFRYITPDGFIGIGKSAPKLSDMLEIITEDFSGTLIYDDDENDINYNSIKFTASKKFIDLFNDEAKLLMRRECSSLLKNLIEENFSHVIPYAGSLLKQTQEEDFENFYLEFDEPENLIKIFKKIPKMKFIFKRGSYHVAY